MVSFRGFRNFLNRKSGRGGFKILQLNIPYTESKIKVEKGNSLPWKLTTLNVRRFELLRYDTLEYPSNGVVVDGVSFNSLPVSPNQHFCK